MKKILLLLLFMTQMSFADFIDDAESNYYFEIHPNLSRSWELYSGDFKELGIQFLSDLIDDPKVSNISKIHYLISRANFYLLTENKEKQAIDLKKLSELIESDVKCKNEFNFFYNRNDWDFEASESEGS